MTDPGPDAGHYPFIRLIVNADDFGISKAINEGIVRAHRDGIVTSTSLMAVGRAFEQAVDYCHAFPSLDVGVHLALVAEKPLCRNASSLIGEDGRFPPRGSAVALRWLTGRIRRADVQAEWSAQIERVLAQGIAVSHLDSHQHVHVLPGLADLVLQLAEQYKIPFVRVPLEGQCCGKPHSMHDVQRRSGAMLLRILWGLARLVSARKSRSRSLDFLGFQDGGRLDEVRLLRVFSRLQPGRVYELMCHPGLTPDEPEIRRWDYNHAKELQALTSLRIRAAMIEQGIQLCTFAELAREGACHAVF